MKRATLLVTAMVMAVLVAFSGVALAQQTERTASDPKEEQTTASEESSSSQDSAPRTPEEKIPDQYIVVFEDSVRDPSAVANEHAREQGLQLKHVYRHAIKGYAAVFPNERALQRVQNDERVDYVEQDQVVGITAQDDGPKKAEKDSKKTAKPSAKPGGGSTSQTLPWGIDRIDADESSTKAGDGSGTISKVNAYIIDTGIDTSHTDLNVVNHVNPSFASGGNKDCHGHGTHVAGTVAAKDNQQDVVGVDGTPLTGVKVLNCSGSGSWSGVVAGVDWVTGNAKKPAIANMSLGGGASQSVDDAVKNSADSGVFYSIAAGNDGADACNYSPARAGTHNGVTTTAATDKDDTETSWSNYGKCVDIWAPGRYILSTKKGGGTTTMSGTSMAAPHVGGTGALYLSNTTNAAKTPAEVEGQLKTDAASTTKTSKDGAAIKLVYAKSY